MSSSFTCSDVKMIRVILLECRKSEESTACVGFKVRVIGGFLWGMLGTEISTRSDVTYKLY